MFLKDWHPAYKIILLIVAISGVSVVYYFVIALPQHQKADEALAQQKLELEKQQYQDQQNIKRDAEQQAQADKEAKAEALDNCMQQAQAHYDEVFKLNSTPVLDNPNAASWNSYMIKNDTEARLKSDKELCIQQYGGE